jgi:hypothetical protein
MGGAQSPILRVNEPKMTIARSAAKTLLSLSPLSVLRNAAACIGSDLFYISIREERRSSGWAVGRIGGAQSPILSVHELKKTGARSAEKPSNLSIMMKGRKSKK